MPLAYFVIPKTGQRTGYEETMAFLLGHETYADFSISTSPALERAVMEGISPNTVTLDIFPEDSFTVGVLDDPEKAIDLDFCRRQGVVVLRRNTTGGTIYAGKGSAMICYYLRTSDPWVPHAIGEAFPKFLGDFAQAARELFGFPARYRPLNDVEVEGRKLMPTSCKIERDTLVFRLVLNVKPQNTEITSRAILLPPEKVPGQSSEDHGGKVYLPGKGGGPGDSRRRTWKIFLRRPFNFLSEKWSLLPEG